MKILINEAARIIVNRAKRHRLSTKELIKSSGLNTSDTIVVKQILKVTWNAIHQENNVLIGMLKGFDSRTRFCTKNMLRTYGRNQKVNSSFVNTIIRFYNHFYNELLSTKLKNRKHAITKIAKRVYN